MKHIIDLILQELINRDLSHTVEAKKRIKKELLKLSLTEYDLLLEECINSTKIEIPMLVLPFILQNFPPTISQTNRLIKLIENKIDNGKIFALAFTTLPKKDQYVRIYNEFGSNVHFALSKNPSLPNEIALRGFKDYVNFNQTLAISFLTNQSITTDQLVESLRRFKLRDLVSLFAKIESRIFTTEQLWFLETYFKEDKNIVEQIKQMPNYTDNASVILSYF